MKAWYFFARRLSHSLLTLLAVMTLMWGLFRLIPGDPTSVFLGAGELPPEAVDALRKSWGLDAPLFQQYLDYVANLATGNLGLSFYFRRPVVEILLPAMWNTMLLLGVAIGLAGVCAIKLGTYLGWHRGTRVEEIGSLLVIVPRSLPIFWIGILLLMVFAYGLNWFPIGGIRTPGFVPETMIEQIPGYDVLLHMVLPVSAAFVYFIADPTMIMRTSMLEVTREDFLTFARAKGLPEKEVRRIARRNALLPVLTYLGIMIGFAFGGQVLLEVVFSWPGMGRLMVNAVLQRDYPVAQAAFFSMAVIIISLNFILDLLYGYLDPRISYE